MRVATETVEQDVAKFLGRGRVDARVDIGLRDRIIA